MTSGLFSDHWVSHSLEGVMGAALHVPVVLLCSAYRAFSCSWPSTPFLFIFLFIIYPVGLGCAGTWARAGRFSSTGLMAGLQVGQAL